jgi:hypothetical protein
MPVYMPMIINKLNLLSSVRLFVFDTMLVPISNHPGYVGGENRQDCSI